MIEWKCDICRRPAPYPNRRRLNAGAIHDITGAEQICAACLERVRKTDWNAVIRRELEERKADNG